jgi:hypothetical protein
VVAGAHLQALQRNFFIDNAERSNILKAQSSSRKTAFPRGEPGKVLAE